jgi:peptidoglycan hydrolase-like protein with peptidoglycan-binding domain
MSKSFNYEAEPFQSFTEFDEYESSDEFDEFGEPEFGDFETFESDFEFEPEEERGRVPRAAGGRAPARGGGPARGMGARAVGGRAPGRPGRPGMRQARGMRGPGGMRRAGPRGPGAMRGRAGMRRPGMRGPGMRGPGMRRPGPENRPRRRWPYPFPAYPGYVVPQPVEWPIGGPAVGRFGNWMRSGNDVILLLDEDAIPLEGAAAASPEGAAPEGAGGAPSEGAAGAPAEGAGGTPPEGGSDASASGSEGELPGRGGLSRRKLGKIQKALNFLIGLRLEPHGLSNPQTRSALRSYQQQKGLVPHGQVDHETETEMAYDLEDSMSEYEMEFGGSSCLAACEAARRSCVASGADPFDCFFAFTDCLLKCPDLKECPPRPILRRGSKGNRVREAQARLNARGATPPLVVDGDFGPKTEAAVRKFQLSRGLAVDGVIGKDTWNALGC